MDEQRLTTAQVMARMNVSRSTVERWIRAGKLAPVRVGSIRRIPESQIDALEAADETSREK